MSTSFEPIAIVGSSCRFPGGASSPSKLWDLLYQPRDVLQEFSTDRLNLRRFYNKNGDVHGATNVENKSYLLVEDSRVFDPAFFGISPREAEGMDPQQRILLEAVYEMFESAGYTLDQVAGSKMSVHVGVMTGDYADIQVRDLETAPQYSATGTGRSILSNRVSYIFDLRGPSITLDTACSSSLVAMHQAIQSLHAGEATSAIVGGVNLIFDPSLYVMESKLHMLSPESRSRMWDKTANGYARGEGVAAILLKPLSQAIRDNDHIEAVVRATGVNSDGHSQGITMPRAVAQAALIRETYQKAGMDPIKDRCQYFECHGTGTKAGDPVEARAIFEALLDPQKSSNAENEIDGLIEPLYVGSVKTVIGHLEGCAGLAGVLKVILALQHRTIPPNLLFQELNPEIEQFYGRIQIPTTALPWPKLESGAPRRASVNSFGFGGTNAHAIIESYDQLDENQSSRGTINKESKLIGPFICSAHTGSSLLGNVKALFHHLTENPSIDLEDLAWVLQDRRTTHRTRTYFAADNRQQLLASLGKFVTDSQSSNAVEIGTRWQPINPTEVPGILGVFTGQGAQWPSMGRELIDKSPLFRQTLERCDVVLKALKDGPEWSIIEELQASSTPASAERMTKAAISQPLCTAVQIALTDLLTAAGIRFAAVVGHSSGEIAATYACGIISLESAVQIAFYRGKHAHLAQGLNGERGAMLAVGIGYEAAEQFCDQPRYRGRIGVAAGNGPQSVTLSGNIQDIHHAKDFFEGKNTFCRLLRVDTAYHSHHMNQCAGSYLNSLLECNIQVHQPREGCIWNSSVRGDTELLHGDLQTLKGSYWVKNMTAPVLFYHALRSSIWHGGPYDLAVEVGPSSALKGPTEQTLKSAFGRAPAYTGTLSRGNSDSEAFTAALGFVWSHLGSNFVDFGKFRKSSGNAGFISTPKPVKNLPSYTWDHDEIYWRESRISKRFRTNVDSGHELLGRRVPDDTERDRRWRNILKLSELPWVRGHEILGQALLPGASYVALAFEAGKQLAAGQPIKLLEVQNVDILRPVVVPSGRDGNETVFTTHLVASADSKTLIFDFAYYYCPDERIGTMIQTATGRLLVHLGSASEDELPSRVDSRAGLLPVESADVYGTLKGAGMHYSGLFDRLHHIQRSRDYATATATWTSEEFSDQYTAHPAIVDVCFQSLIVAHSDPNTGLLPSTLLPVRIERLLLNPNVQWANTSGSINLTFDSFVTQHNGASVGGDLYIYNADSGKSILQVETLSVKPITEPTANEDRQLFSEIVFKPDVSLSIVDIPRNDEHDQREVIAAEDIDRVTLYYMQRVLEAVDATERASSAWYFQNMFAAFERMVQMVRQGEHPLASKDWLTDGADILDTLFKKHPDQIDMIAAQRVGENLVDVVRGKTQILEVLLQDNVLGQVYTFGCGYPILTAAIASACEQISHKFPRANVLEIGAGTGATTSTFLKTVGNAFGTYTYTDISTGFFETAADRFSDHAEKMIFKALDVGRDVASQGFEEHSYDVIIAANVLHATPSITETLRNARALLKPGGFLLLLEITGLDVLRTPFCMAALPGWYLGKDEGRSLHPGISVEEWDVRLQDTGYSGVDVVFHDTKDREKHAFSFIVSQAVDDTVLQLRDPLGPLSDIPRQETLLLVGGKTLSVSKVSMALSKLASSAWKSRIITASDIEKVDFSKVHANADVICLQELDNPLFSAKLTPKILGALQELIRRSRNLLWVTENRRLSSPHSNMVLGIKRALSQELPQLNFQLLDLELDSKSPTTVRTLLEVFARMKILANQKQNQAKLLWSQESELVLVDGLFLVPRVIPSAEMNDRYNSIRRTVNKPTSVTDGALRLEVQNEKLILSERRKILSDTCISVRVKYSLLIPYKHDDDGQYISVGHIENSTQTVLIYSSSNASNVEVSPAYLTPILEEHCNYITLQAVVTQLLVQAASNITTGQIPVLFFEVTEAMAEVISAAFKFRGREVLFASTNSTAPSNWIKLHPRSSARAVQSVIPKDLLLCIDCSILSGPDAVSPLVGLPSTCTIRKLDKWIFEQEIAANSSANWLETTYSAIQLYLSSGLADSKSLFSCDVVDIHDIPGSDKSILRRIHVTSWETERPLTVNIQPVDKDPLFDPKKSYLMIGMAGGLGLSICEWAVRKGAKSLVITSRKPSIDLLWLRNARVHGAEIHVRSVDVTDIASLRSTVDEVRQNLPPIGGICNAAMVLDDKLFVDMTAESFNVALGPKVDGSRNLHEVFADIPLDFFILLSSIACVFGNPGQSNYHAANEYMVGLAKQRRHAGLPASVIHIGGVTDVGYVTRQARSVIANFRSLHISFVSENDVHYAFAEAIFAGKPENDRACEVIMGIDPSKMQVNQEELPAWLRDPRCSHLLPPVLVEKDQLLARSNQENIKLLVEEADTEEKAIEIVQIAFCVRLESMMQLPAGSVEVQLSLVELGIDSLVAVEIRMWFLKELGTDVPVLKILGGDSVAQICTSAAKQLLAKQLGKKEKPQPVISSTETAVNPDPSVKSSVGSDGSATPTESLPTDLGSEDGGEIDADLKVKTSDVEVEGVTPQHLVNMDTQTDEPSREVIREIIREEKMSGAQSRIWTLSKYLKDPTTYNLLFSFEMLGHLDVQRMESALITVMQHHESLRTSFYARPEDNHPMQGILKTPIPMFKHLQQANDDQIATYVHLAKTHNWDIENGNTFGMTILSKNSQNHTIIFAYHHIIMDAMGWHVFLRDLEAAYQLRALKTQSKTYIEYTLHQSEVEESGNFRTQLEYWQREYLTIPPVLPLLPMSRQIVRPREPNMETFCGFREIDTALSRAIKRACQSLKITSFHFHLAIIQVLLVQYLDISDLSIGIADANRLDDDYAETVGFFMNLLPLRFQVSKDSRFAQVAQNTSRKVRTALENSAVPFNMILDHLKVIRSSSHTPLFQVAVNYRLGAAIKLPFADTVFSLTAVQDAKNPYDISFGISEADSGPSYVEMTFQTSLYDRNACDTVLDAYMRLLTNLSSDYDSIIRDCSPHSVEDVEKAIDLGRGPEVKYDWPSTLSSRFASICQSRAKYLAIKDKHAYLTYAQLEIKVHSIAAAMINAGSKIGSRVAVLCEPSADLVASFLAILQIGGVYVPLDLSLPSARHEKILRSCQPSIMLYHSPTQELAHGFQITGSVDFINLDQAYENSHTIISDVPADSAAVLLYTSGSTGEPKGVLLSQANFVNHLALKTQALNLSHTDVLLQQSSFGFDMSLIQVLCALCNGGRLVIVPRESRQDPIEIVRLVQENNVTLTIATPSEYLTWLQYGSDTLRQNLSWRNACMGGETVHAQLKKEFHRLSLPHLVLTNCYGPTEITAAATFKTISFEDDSLEYGSVVGKALPNYSLTVLSADGKALPPGHRGEIGIGGAGVAMGYLNSPAEEAKKFINCLELPARIYRTGDMGILDTDGNLRLLGRMDGDTQVKLRGIRFDLTEIERALIDLSGGALKSVVVTIHGDTIIAHAVKTSNHILEEIDPYKLLGQQFPQYMIPTRLIIVNSLPITSNGKIDRKAVRELASIDTLAEVTKRVKLTLPEGELRLLWEKVLPPLDHPLTPNSDFFVEGGNSLLMVKLQHAIRESIGLSITTRDLYLNPTLQQMADRIHSQRKSTLPDDANINWAAETAVSESVLMSVSHPVETRDTSANDKLRVLMTGATSFLGHAILHTLSQDDQVSQVHCIAIAPDDHGKLQKIDKVAIYTGSLSSPTLGLNEAEQRYLRSNIDIIIHAGTSGHCLNNYSSVKAANVQATHFLASLALPKAIPLLYLSSNRVVTLSGETSLPPVSVAQFKPSTTGSEGFTASKWASECFLENLVSQTELPVEIHRPCVVVGDNAPSSDALNAILRYALLTKAVPRFERLEGYFDFKSVEAVANEIAVAATSMARVPARKLNNITFHHHSSGRKVALEDARSFMEELHGCAFEELDIRAWIEKALDAGMDSLITSYLESLIEGGGKLRFPYMGEALS